MENRTQWEPQRWRQKKNLLNVCYCGRKMKSTKKTFMNESKAIKAKSAIKNCCWLKSQVFYNVLANEVNIRWNQTNRQKNFQRTTRKMIATNVVCFRKIDGNGRKSRQLEIQSVSRFASILQHWNKSARKTFKCWHIKQRSAWNVSWMSRRVLTWN